MPTVVGVRLRPGGKVLTFEAAGTEPEPGDTVIVSTERGEEIGEAVTGPEDVADEDIERKLKPVLRIATDRDRQIAEELADKEAQAMRRYRELVGEHGLDMKPVAVEALFDGRKIIFYFTAEERVDFRDLVKDLAREFKARIDMRQIGVRDEARMVGGLGHCGQRLCCVRFGGEFEPVSIRMAKAQDLPLNPLKISGLCGRLMCCLRYEYPSYKDFKSRAPKVGARIDTPRGDAKVIGLDAPRELVTLKIGDSRVEVPLGHMECGGCQSGKPCKISTEALESVEGSQLAAALGALDTGERSERSGQKRRRPAKGQSDKGSSKDKGSGQSKDDDSGKSKGGSKRSSRRRRSKKRRSSSGGSQGKGSGSGQKSQKGSGQASSSGKQRGDSSKSGKQAASGKGSGSQGSKKGGSSSGSSGGSSGTGRRRRRRRSREKGDD
jgi:cell fate regulator YaaT (PSP1 superfamily)